jgi:hypothetical protein
MRHPNSSQFKKFFLNYRSPSVLLNKKPKGFKLSKNQRAGKPTMLIKIEALPTRVARLGMLPQWVIPCSHRIHPCCALMGYKRSVDLLVTIMGSRIVFIHS